MNVQFLILEEQKFDEEGQYIIPLLEISLEDFPFSSLFSIRRTTHLFKKRERKPLVVSSELIAEFKPTQNELAEMLRTLFEVHLDTSPPHKLRTVYFKKAELYFGIEQSWVKQNYNKRRALKVYFDDYTFIVSHFPLWRLIFELNDYCNVDTEEIRIIKTRLAIRRKLLRKIFNDPDKLDDNE